MRTTRMTANGGTRHSGRSRSPALRRANHDIPACRKFGPAGGGGFECGSYQRALLNRNPPVEEVIGVEGLSIDVQLGDKWPLAPRVDGNVDMRRAPGVRYGSDR